MLIVFNYMLVIALVIIGVLLYFVAKRESQNKKLIIGILNGILAWIILVIIYGFILM